MSSKLALGVVAVVAIVAMVMVVWPGSAPSFSEEDIVGQAGAVVCPNPADGEGTPPIYASEMETYWGSGSASPADPYTMADRLGKQVMDGVEAQLPGAVASATGRAAQKCGSRVPCQPTVVYEKKDVLCEFKKDNQVYYAETVSVQAPKTTEIGCTATVTDRASTYGAEWVGFRDMILSATLKTVVYLPCNAGQQTTIEETEETKDKTETSDATENKGLQFSTSK